MVIRADGQSPAAPGWLPLAQLGAVRLYLARRGTERRGRFVYSVPAVAEKRGSRSAAGADVGIDGHATDQAYLRSGAGVVAPATLDAAIAVASQPDTLLCSLAGAADARAGALRVAVIDVSFDNHGVLDGLGHDGAAVDGPYLIGLPTGEAPAPLGEAPGHGTAMAGVVLNDVPAVRVGLFQLPSVGGAAPVYLAATSLAMIVAAAVERWKADVMLIAMSDGAWGTPPHLRDVLREAVRVGRAGLGTAIFCSVGDPSRNHARDHDSAALGVDDLASQPWLTAVAACDQQNRWYRTYPAHRRGAAATYNRFGPAVALSACGAPRRHGAHVAADDSSQAAALVAAAAARVLRANDRLTVDELKSVLTLTADVPAVVDLDGGAGAGTAVRALAAGFADGRDRLGHNLKVGYGALNAEAATLAARDPVAWSLLATRLVPDPPPGGTSLAQQMATCWDQSICQSAAAGSEMARAYVCVRPRLCRLVMSCLPLAEALLWLARHLRALHEAYDAGDTLWFDSDQDHGALKDRICHLADVLSQANALGNDAETSTWAGGFGSLVQRLDATRLATFLSGAFCPVRKRRGIGGPSPRWKRRAGSHAHRGPT